MPVKDHLPGTPLNSLQSKKKVNINSVNTSNKVIGKQSTLPPSQPPSTKHLDKIVDIIPQGTAVNVTEVSEAIVTIPSSTIGLGTIIAKIPFFQLKRLQSIGKRPVIVSNPADKSRSILIRNPVITVQQNPSVMNSTLVQNNAATTKEIVRSMSQVSCNSIITDKSSNNSIPVVSTYNIPVVSTNIISNGTVSTEFQKNEQEKVVEDMIHVTPEVTLIRKPRDTVKANQTNHDENNLNGIVAGTFI